MVKKGVKANNLNKRGKNNKRPSLNPRPTNPNSIPAGTPKPANPSSIASMLEFPALLSHQTDTLQPVKKWCFKNGTSIMKPLIRKSYFLNGQEVTLTEAPTTP
jgi:hypothetical protein